MASRRKLKKTIQFISSELISDIYFRCLMTKDIDAEKVDAVSVVVMALSREYILRANRPDGKDNPKLVKAYYRKMFIDWQLAIQGVIKEIESI
ncbi:MAG: hypothetical protein KA172_03165 [Paludibacter sp.]|jgi:hypothetical protein|nr:hypothetical protein [Paludibacter sp.]MBP7613516.1 hypothetical protein [Paludibacter sp.]MBV5281242.1 hypothetical protein [Paludibacter sp.]